MDNLFIWLIYPLVMTHLAIENGHLGESSQKKMVISHSCVGLQEGTIPVAYISFPCWNYQPGIAPQIGYNDRCLLLVNIIQ